MLINNKCLELTMKNMFYPCMYTSLTTIVAFSSLLFSDIRPVIDFGKVMIIALLIIFITSFTILPLIISLFPKNFNNYNFKFKINHMFFKISSNNTYSILIFNILLFIISIYGITNLNVENSFINYFKKDSEIHKGMKLIDEELGGTTPLDIIISFKENNLATNNTNNNSSEDEIELDIEIDENLFSNNLEENWFNNEKINAIREIHNYLENKKEIGKVQSIYSLIEVADNINKEPLDSFELNVIYKEIPEEYKITLISPYLSVEKNMTKITARVIDSQEIKTNKCKNTTNLQVVQRFKVLMK